MKERVLQAIVNQAMQQQNGGQISNTISDYPGVKQAHVYMKAAEISKQQASESQIVAAARVKQAQMRLQAAAAAAKAEELRAAGAIAPFSAKATSAKETSKKKKSG